MLRRFALAAALCALVLGGCTLGQPSSFTGRAQRLCKEGVQSVDDLQAAGAGLDQLRYASARYAVLERTVSEITDDIGFPDGQRGTTMRDRWLRPSRASLKQGLADLSTLRTVIDRRADAQRVDTVLRAALAAGTVGVDVGFLGRENMPACAELFGAAHHAK